MGFLSALETRASIEDPQIPLSDPGVLAVLFGETARSATGIQVTTEKALGVPAVWAAVNFISNTIASLPLKVYRRTDAGREEVPRSNALFSMLHDVVNEDRLTSFKWRKLQMTSILTGGRAFTYIERNRANQVQNLWPLDPANVIVRNEDNRTFYEVKDSKTRKITYEASEVLDLPFTLQSDGISHRAPVSTLRNALGLAIAMEEYASRFFQNGGVPPLALQGPQASHGAAQRAKAAVDDAIKRANEQNRNILYMPAGHTLESLGFNPEQAQLIEARLFQLQEVARIYGIPPMFLQDLSHGTFSNTEQQDLHFVKHTLIHWLRLWEQEFNAKLFAPGQRTRFVEFSVDGLLRGDFVSRMSGAAQAVQNALRTPNEMREKDNLPPLEGGDQLFIQGATVSIQSAGQEQPSFDGGDEAGEENGE